MQCKSVREKLLTDYLDGQLSAKEKSRIEGHLGGCSDCRAFLETVRKTAVAPFKDTGEMVPDPRVWDRIEAGIEAEQVRSSGGFWKTLDRFLERLPVPVPVTRAAVAGALILLGVVLVNWPSSYAEPVYNYMSEQMAFMGELGSGNTDLLNGDLKGYETFLEGNTL